MANTIKVKRGTNLSNAGTPAAGELVWNSNTNKLYVGNGSTAATGLTAIGGNIYTAGTGLDLSSTGFSVDVSDLMSNGSNNRIVTATGTDAMNAEANLTFDGGLLSVTRDNGIAQTTVLSLKAYDPNGDQTASLTADIDFHLWDSNTQLSTPQARIGVIGNSTGNQNAESGGILAFYTNVAIYSSPSLT